MLLDECAKTGRAHFLFTFEDEFDVMFQQVVFRNVLESLSLDERLALIVVGPTCPNASVAHLCFKRFAVPKLERFCGHNVIVTVNKHGFGIGIDHLFSVNHGIAIRRHHLGTVYSSHQQQLFPPFGTTLHVRFVRLLSANTGYADKAKKLIEHTFFVLLNILLYHLISDLGKILSRFWLDLRAMGSADAWDLTACCICMAHPMPCILYSPDRYDRIIRVDVHGFSDCFRIVFSTVCVG